MITGTVPLNPIGGYVMLINLKGVLVNNSTTLIVIGILVFAIALLWISAAYFRKFLATYPAEKPLDKPELTYTAGVTLTMAIAAGGMIAIAAAVKQNQAWPLLVATILGAISMIVMGVTYWVVSWQKGKYKDADVAKTKRDRGMSQASFILAAAVALLGTGIWAYLNR